MKKDIRTNSEPLAIIGTRVADERQLDESHHMQERECRILADKLGVKVHKVWNMPVSGNIEGRENFTDILKEIDELGGRVKYYLFYSIERFTRAGPPTYEKMKEELRKRGVQIRDVRA